MRRRPQHGVPADPGHTVSSPAATAAEEMSNDGACVATATAQALTQSLVTETDKAVAIFEFVRDSVVFGFTRHFDGATPDQTLALGRGHCNPQAMLCVTMMRAAGLQARLRVFEIHNDILEGVLPARPSRLDHAITEVRIDNAWIGLDGYIVDAPLMVAGRRRLVREGRTVGYGVHVRGQSQWDGASDCRCQLVDNAMITGEYGVMDSLQPLLADTDRNHRMNAVERLLYSLAVPSINRSLARVRSEAPSGAAACAVRGGGQSTSRR